MDRYLNKRVSTQPAAPQKHVVEEEEFEEVEEQYYQREKGFLQRILDRFVGEEENEEYIEEDAVVVEETIVPQDLKLALKIAHKWLNKLPPYEMKAFKKSKDFEDFKAILKNYGLAK